MNEREQLEQGITYMESQRALLGDAAVDAAIAGLRQKLAAMEQSGPAAPLSAQRPLESALEGERKFVTVIFADISGFTTLSETMGPEAVRDLINACFERLVPFIEKYEGVVDKFMGDQIMALFGAPITHENDPERASLAALDMMEALTAFNAERDTDLGLHIGINTGLVIAGSIGTKDRRQYSVMGDAVNVASRLEDISERGEILVGPDTYRLTLPLFEFETLPPIQVKGKAKPVPAYRLLAVRTTPGQLRGIAGLASSLVGRQAELQALHAAIEQLDAGQGGIVTLVGEAGLGKSRLVAELRAQVLQGREEMPSPGETRPLWVEGRCLSFGKSIAYLLWLDMLRGVLGIALDDAPEVVRDALREQVQRLCPNCFEAVYPYLGRMMSLPLAEKESGPLQNLEGEQLKTSTFQAVETLIESAARQQPMILVCEDLHWADPTSIELLKHLLALTERVPLLLLCLFRPERGHYCWDIRETAIGLYHQRYTDLWLSPLSLTESEQLVGNLLRVEDLPPQLRERMFACAEGNPFYMEEIIRSLIDSGDVRHDEATGRWGATRDVATIAIPDTLHGVLVARIDRLREETKRVLQMAAVVGRIFLYRILATIAATIPVDKARGIDPPTLQSHLQTLQREEMIRERVPLPELEYIFKHHLTQEAAYNSLLKRDRRLFHRQVAEALERLFTDFIDEHIGLLAYHWEQAQEPEKATTYLLRAGDQARMACAQQEAIDYYQRALLFLKEGAHYGQAARTLMKLGLTYHSAFDFQHSRQAYEEGFVLWQRAGEIQPDSPPPPAPHALRIVCPTVSSLDPGKNVTGESSQVTTQLFSGLLTLTPELGVVPDAAKRWEISEAGHKYTFYLRDDARWSDGTPVTAADFEYAWLRMLDPIAGSVYANLLYDIKGARAFHQGEASDPKLVGIRALDALTLAVELEGPTAYFLHLLAHASSLPVPQHVVEAHGEAWTEPGNLVCNGPFLLESWQRGKTMVLVRNPHYHGSFGGNLERVELFFGGENPLSLLERYEADDLDVFFLHGLPPKEIDRARQRHASEYLTVPVFSTYFCLFDTNRPPFDDLRVRRAFALAIDKETMAGVAIKGYEFPAMGGFVPQGLPGHRSGIGLPYDPEQARQLLAEAGYPQSQGLPVLELYTFRRLLPNSEYMRAQWQEQLGAKIETWERPADDGEMPPPHIVLLGWLADYPDPDNFLRAALHMDFLRGICGIQFNWQDETFDQLVKAAGRLADQAERMKLYGQADEILIQHAVIAPFAYARLQLLVKPCLTKFLVSGIQWWFWKDVVIAELGN